MQPIAVPSNLAPHHPRHSPPCLPACLPLCAQTLREYSDELSTLREARTAESRSIVELIKETCALNRNLLLLENFAVINFEGFGKALKKHDKRTGHVTKDKYLASILSQKPSFALYPELVQLIAETECLFAELDKSGDHTAPESGIAG
jgi:SPX domain protein involved in polyphosphate accumulation